MRVQVFYHAHLVTPTVSCKSNAASESFFSLLMQAGAAVNLQPWESAPVLIDGSQPFRLALMSSTFLHGPAPGVLLTVGISRGLITLVLPDMSGLGTCFS